MPANSRLFDRDAAKDSVDRVVKYWHGRCNPFFSSKAAFTDAYCVSFQKAFVIGFVSGVAGHQRNDSRITSGRMFLFGVWPFRAADFCFQKEVSEMFVKMLVPVAAALVSLVIGTSTAEASHHRHRCCYRPVCCEPVCCEPVCCRPACANKCSSSGCCQTACIQTSDCCTTQSACCVAAPVYYRSQPACCGTVVYSGVPVLASRPVSTYVTFAR